MEPGIAYSTTTEPIAPKVSAPMPIYQPPTKLIVVVSVIIILVLAGVYVFKRKSASLTTNTPVPTPTISTYFPGATTPIPLTANSDWQTYADPTNVFSVKYPPEYKLSNYTESAFSGIQLNFNKPATSASASAQIAVKIIYLQHSAKTATQFAHDQNILEKDSTLNGLTLSLKGEWGRGEVIFMQQGSTVYRLSSVIAAPLNFVPTYEDTINKIFASFTILNPDDRGK